MYTFSDSLILLFIESNFGVEKIKDLFLVVTVISFIHHKYNIYCIYLRSSYKRFFKISIVHPLYSIVLSVNYK